MTSWKDNTKQPPARKPREGWGDAFRAVHEAGDDRVLAPGVALNSWDDTEWEWSGYGRHDDRHAPTCASIGG